VTKFETIGVERQQDADSKAEARKFFRGSCYACCNKGIRIECDRCAIAHVHSEVVAIFDDIEQRRK
jgi:hypothetical protein